METLLRDGLTVAPGRTITVGPADNGRMVALRMGDRLAMTMPVVAGVSWRLRGGAPMLEEAAPHAGEAAMVLQAVRPGRTGIDLLASGSAMPLPRPLRLIVTVG
jgi:hypothetical protein